MNLNELYEQRRSYFLEAPKSLQTAVMIALALGAASLIYGFLAGQGERVWGAFLFNLFFFFCLGLGGMAFSAIQDVIGAVWARPIRRIQEAFGAFVPMGGLLFLVFLLAVALNIGDAGKIYRWIENPDMLHHFHGKKQYLVPFWFYVRVVTCVVLLVGLTLWQLKHTLKRDQVFLAGQKEEAQEMGVIGNFKLRFWSAPILVVYGVAFSLLCFDLTMSLSPLWFSTLWGGWQFAVMMQTLMASLLITMFALKSTKIGQAIQRQQFHDVGKLMHGFTVFFAYLTYAHVLTYWYGNVPEETEYFLHRLHEPWLTFLLIIPVIGFLIPLYGLIFKASKWTASAAIPFASLILLAQWFSYMLIVMPEVIDGKTFGFPVIEIGLFFGMFGLFVSTILWFAKKNPMLPLADPLFAKSLASDHH